MRAPTAADGRGPASSSTGGNIRILIPVAIAVLVFGATLYFVGRTADTPVGDGMSAPLEPDAASSVPTTAAAPEAPSATPPTESAMPAAGEAGAVLQHGLVRHAVALEPLDGVKIELRRQDAARRTSERGPPIATTTSLADGTYRLAVPAGSHRDSWILDYSKDGFVPERAQAFEPLYLGTSEIELNPVHLAPGIHVTGEVTTADGKPAGPGVAYAHCSLTKEPPRDRTTSSGEAFVLASRGWQPQSADIDANGRFTIWLPPGLTAIEANVSGLAPGLSEPFELTHAESSNVRIALVEGKTFAGIVQDEDSKPVAGARIDVTPAIADREPDRRFARYRARGTAETGADGSFRIPDMSGEVTSLTVRHDAHPPHHERQERIRAGGEPYVVTLERGQWLTGRLALADGTPPPAGRGTLQLSEREQAESIAGADGKFRTDAFSAHAAGGTLRPAHLSPKELTWEAGPGERNLGTIECDLGSVLLVSVTDAAGAPLAGATVACAPPPELQSRRGFTPQPATRVTGADGVARVTGLAPGKIIASARRPRYAPAEAGALLEAGQAEHTVTVALQEPGRLFLTVQDAAGSPLAGVWTSLGAGDANRAFSRYFRPRQPSFSDAAGRVAIPDVEVAKGLRLTLSREGLPATDVPIEPFAPGETRDLGVIVVHAGYSVAGTVTDKAGTPIPNATVTLHPDFTGRSGRSWTPPPVTTSDTEGRFVSAALANGSYFTSAEADGFLQANGQSVTVKDENLLDLAIILEAAEVYAGVVVHADGSPAAGLDIWLQAPSMSRRVDTRTHSDGSFRFGSAPAGPVELHLSSRSNPARPQIDYRLEAASVRDLPAKIELPAASTIELTVKATGERSPPARIVCSVAPIVGGRGHRGPNRTLDLDDGVGRVEVVQPGPHEVALYPKEFPLPPPQRIEVVSGGTTPVEFVLDGTRPAVTIRVRDPAGAPVAGASVLLHEPSDSPLATGYSMSKGLTTITVDGKSSVERRTDSEGTGVTYDLGDERRALRVGAAGYPTFEVENALAPVSNGEMQVTLETPSAFLVTVLDARGQPANGVRVSAQKTTGGRLVRQRFLGGFDGRYQDTETRDGLVKVGGLGAGSYRLSFDAMDERVGSLDATIGAGEEQSIQFQMQPPVSIAGLVTENGEPVRGGSLSLVTPDGGWKEATVGSNGTFALELSRAGRCHATYQTSTGEYLGTKEIEVRDGERITLEFATVSLEGRVLLPDGSPAKHLKGGLTGESWQDFTTDGEGRFRIASLSVGTYSWHFQEPPAGCAASAQTLEVTGPVEVVYQFLEGRPLTILLTRGAAPTALSVSHIAADGTQSHIPIDGAKPPEPGVLPLMWPLGPGGGCVFHMPSNTAGSFDMQSISVGYFRVEPDQERVEVTLAPAGWAFLSLRDNEGGAVSNHEFTLDGAATTALEVLRPSLRTDATGNCSLLLPAGEYEAHATFPSGKRATARFQVEPGANDPIVLTEPPQ